MGKSQIEWTEETWNPATGCTKVSEGCKNCYAERIAKRLHGYNQPKYKNKFEYTEHPDTLELPTTWKKPRRIFVNSMSDLFHEDATQGFLDSVFHTMLHLAPQHTYQILTKREDRLANFSREFSNEHGGPIPSHIWVGVSVENAQTTHRICDLQNTQAVKKFVSFEPLLGDVGIVDLQGIDWAIIGGESGPNARPIKKEWIHNIINHCRFYKTAVFFKQWGGRFPKDNGRTLDGKTYDEYPL